MNPARRRVLRGWIAGAALVATAGLVVSVTPGLDQESPPFVVHAERGEPGVGRNIAVTVTGVRRVAELTSAESSWRADGNWLVVDLHAAAVLTQTGTRLGGALLLVDGTTYSATDRIDSMLDTLLVPGVPRAGSVAFELPARLRSGSATLAFSTNRDVRADSQIRIPIDLDTVPVEATAGIGLPDWAR